MKAASEHYFTTGKDHVSVNADWLSVIPCKDACVVVHARPSDDRSILLQVVHEHTWSVDLRNKCASYPALKRIFNEYVVQHGIDAIVLKKGHLGSEGRGHASMISAGELRGVIYIACEQCDIFEINRCVVSRTYGDRKVGEYINDSHFWNERVNGISKSRLHREAAILLLAAVERLNLLPKSPDRRYHRDQGLI